MTNGAIWQMSACELAATITRGDVSCVEAVSSVVNRVAETNGEVNAIVTDLGEQALTQAAEHDRLLQRGVCSGATTGNELYGRTFNPWNEWASAWMQPRR